MKNFILTLGLVFVFATNNFAQDVSFINSNQSLIYLNPSFAGSNGGLRVQTYYQNKWPNISNGQTSVDYYASADVYLKKLKGAFALTYMNGNYNTGLYQNQSLGLSYAQHFTVNDKLKIIPSLQVGVFERRVDISRLHYDSGFPYPYPPRIPSSQKRNMDFSSGLLFQYNNRFYGGVSAFHINQPDEGLLNTSKLPLRLNVHASYNAILSEKTLVQFGTKYTYQSKNYQTLQLAANAVFSKHFVCGLNYTNGNIVGGILGYRANYFVATLNYFRTLSKLSGNNADTWELALSFNLRDKENRKVLTAFEAW